MLVKHDTNTLCSDCESSKKAYTLKLIPSGKLFPYPKFIPQIKESCFDCGRFIKFAKQTKELIDEINELLESQKRGGE